MYMIKLNQGYSRNNLSENERYCLFIKGGKKDRFYFDIKNMIHAHNSSTKIVHKIYLIMVRSHLRILS